MRILLIGDAHSVHYQRWFRALAVGHTVRAAATVCAPALPDPCVRLAVVGTDTPVVRRLVGGVLTGVRLIAVLCSFRPEIVHCQGLWLHPAVLLLAAGRRLVVTLWGTDADPAGREPRRHVFMRRLVLRRARAVTVPSRYLAARVARLVRPGRLHLVPFGVDCEMFRPGAHPGRHVGFVKSLAPHYGLDDLLHAFARLARSMAGVRLLVAGGGTSERVTETRALARRLGIASRVEWLGALPHEAVPPVLARCAVFAMPSHRESFGVAALEASACGLPVIASRVGGIPEVVAHGRTGILIAPGARGELTDALRRLIGNPETARRLGANGRRTVCGQFSWPASVRTMAGVYRRIGVRT